MRVHLRSSVANPLLPNPWLPPFQHPRYPCRRRVEQIIMLAERKELWAVDCGRAGR